MNTKKKTLISILVSAFAVVALVFGLTFGLMDFSPKTQPEEVTPPSNAATSPTNTSGYWTDSGRYGTTAWSGSGTEASPYLIQSAQDLARLSYMVYSGNAPVTSVSWYYYDTYFKQTCDIDLSAYYWRPIGAGGIRSFAGKYNGNGYKISGIFTRSDQTNQGLFGILGDTALITNVEIADSNIQGSNYVGGIAGRVNHATITNCYNKGCSVSGTNVGGIVGYGNYLTITSCFTEGSLIGGNGGQDDGVGGIVGKAENSVVQNCYNTGSINGSDLSVGGIIGTATSTNITNCYNIGSLYQQEQGNCGGIAGAASGTVANCWNAGYVSGQGSSSLGGIIGYSSSATVSSCYYGGSCSVSYGIGTTSSGSSSNTGTTKYSSLNSTSYAKNQSWYTNSTYWNSSYSWDFSNVWLISSSINNGYPTFRESVKPVIHRATYQLATYGYDVYAYATDNIGIDRVQFPTWTALNGQDDIIWHSGTKGYYSVDGQTYNYKYPVKRSEHNNEVDGYTTHVYAYDASGNGSLENDDRIITDSLSTVLWTNIDAYNPEGEESNPSVPSNCGWAYFDLKIVDTAGRHSKTLTNITNEPSGDDQILLGYGSTMTISNIRPINPSLHKLGSVTANAGITDNGDGTYTYTVTTASDTIKINLVLADFDVVLNQAGGSGGTTSVKATNGASMPSITLPTREGYSFEGYEGVGNVVAYSSIDDYRSVHTMRYHFPTGEFASGKTMSVAFRSTHNVTDLDFNDTALSKGDWTQIYYNSHYYILGYFNLLYTTNVSMRFLDINVSSSTSFVIDNFVAGSSLVDYYRKSGASAKTYNMTVETTLRAKWREKTWVDYASVNFGGGTGSQSNPYIISKPTHLALLAKNVNAGTTYSGSYFKQTANLEMGAHKWTPIGTIAAVFSGIYDGGNFSISGLYTDATLNRQGLFGTASGTILNVIVNNSIIQGDGDVGGIVGYAMNGLVIDNCQNKARVSGTGSLIGGILGVISSGKVTITNCINYGDITSTGNGIAGILGYGAYNTSNISECYNYGTITGNINVGGIAGYFLGTIQNCISDATIYSTNTTAGTSLNVGGILGSAQSATTTISNCASYGMIEAYGTTAVGAIAGNKTAGTIENCSFVGTCSQSISFVGTAGATLTSCYIQVKGKGYYTAGDFNGYSVAEGFNEDLPFQNALFTMGIWENQGTQVIKTLTDKGFTLVS